MNYDPSKVPKIDDSEVEKAKELGLFPICVVCLDTGETDEDTTVSLCAFAECIPRIGERIILENESEWIVDRILHRTIRQPGNDLMVLVPTVVATPYSPKLKELGGKHGIDKSAPLEPYGCNRL